MIWAKIRTRQCLCPNPDILTLYISSLLLLHPRLIVAVDGASHTDAKCTLEQSSQFLQSHTGIIWGPGNEKGLFVPDINVLGDVITSELLLVHQFLPDIGMHSLFCANTHIHHFCLQGPNTNRNQMACSECENFPVSGASWCFILYKGVKNGQLMQTL